MSFTFLMVPKPNQRSPAELQLWLQFHQAASLELLQKTDGVFCISDAAWLFDMKRALPAFGRVFHEAVQRNLRLFSVQFEGEEALSHVWIHPPTPDLTKFLSS